MLSADFRTLIFYNNSLMVAAEWNKSVFLDGIIDCHHRYQLLTNDCHWSCHRHWSCNRHNHNGIVIFWFFLWIHRGSTVVMSYCSFSLHKKSQHFSYLAYISSRTFFNKASFTESSCFFTYISQTNFSMSLNCVLLTVSFSSVSLNTFISIEFFRKCCWKVAPSESMITS